MISRSSKTLLSIAAVLIVSVAATGVWFWHTVSFWFRGERSYLLGTKGRITYPFNSYGIAAILTRELSNSVSPIEIRAWATELFGKFPQGTTGGGLAGNAPELPRGLSNLLQHLPAPNTPWAVSIQTNETGDARMNIISLGGFGSHGIIVLTSTNASLPANDVLDADPYTLTIAPGVYIHRTP